MYPSTSWNFLGLDSSESSFEDARFIILPVPYDSTSSYRPGSRKGPSCVIEASRYVELFDVELGEKPYLKGVYTFDELEPVRGNAAETLDRISQASKYIIGEEKIPVLIGGEHTITLGAVSVLPKDVTVIILDAHADLRESYQGDSLSHACVTRRILEKGREVVQIGVRSMSEEEFNYVSQNDLNIFYRDTIRKTGLHKFLRGLQNIVEKRAVYLSIDVDVLDPSEAPAVSTPEPDGLSFFEVKEIVRTICCSSLVRGIDLVEVTPIYGNTITEFLAATLLYKVIGYIQ